MPTLLADRYNLIRLIGKGGYGEVWLARDERDHHDVAVKILNVSDTSRSGARQKMERFRHEAISMSKIRHANVVAILDVGAVANKMELFLVMELLEGRNLAEEFELRGALDPLRCQRRFNEALDGLEAAHAQGIVHKDLKPANLFLNDVDGRREQLKLIDFGIARMSSLSKLTGTGRMAGSPRYLAPEYIMGESVTPAVDVYQMALILVEALTGEACISRSLEFFAICQAHILGHLHIPDALTRSELGPVIARATRRRPNERYQSAGEFRDALNAVRWDKLPPLVSAPTAESLPPDLEQTIQDAPAITAMVANLRDQERTSLYARPEARSPAGSFPAATPPAAAPSLPGSAVAPTPQPAAPDQHGRRMLWLVWIAAATLLAALSAGAAVYVMRINAAPASDQPPASQSSTTAEPETLPRRAPRIDE